MVAANFEHRCIDVGVQHQAAGANFAAHQPNQVAGAAGEIKHALAGRRCWGNGEALPDVRCRPPDIASFMAMSYQGDRIEHIAHLALLFVFGDGLVAGKVVPSANGRSPAARVGLSVTLGLPCPAARDSRARGRPVRCRACADSPTSRCRSCQTVAEGGSDGVHAHRLQLGDVHCPFADLQHLPAPARGHVPRRTASKRAGTQKLSSCDAAPRW